MIVTMHGGPDDGSTREVPDGSRHVDVAVVEHRIEGVLTLCGFETEVEATFIREERRLPIRRGPGGTLIALWHE